MAVARVDSLNALATHANAERCYTIISSSTCSRRRDHLAIASTCIFSGSHRDMLWKECRNTINRFAQHKFTVKRAKRATNYRHRFGGHWKRDPLGILAAARFLPWTGFSPSTVQSIVTDVESNKAIRKIGFDGGSRSNVLPSTSFDTGPKPLPLNAWIVMTYLEPFFRSVRTYSQLLFSLTNTAVLMNASFFESKILYPML